jgi:hypothetical protein
LFWSGKTGQKNKFQRIQESALNLLADAEPLYFREILVEREPLSIDIF